MSSAHLTPKDPNSSASLLDGLRLNLVDEAVDLIARRRYGPALSAILAVERIESGEAKKAAPHLAELDFETDYAAAQAPE